MVQIEYTTCWDDFEEEHIREIIPGDAATLTCDECVGGIVKSLFETSLLNEDNPWPSLAGRLIQADRVADIFGPEFMKKWDVALREPLTLVRRRRYCRWATLDNPYVDCGGFVEPVNPVDARPKSTKCQKCKREACQICAAPIGPGALGGLSEHICTFVAEPPIEEAPPGMQQGIEWQRCPHSKCLKIFVLADGCNAVRCQSLGCQTQFCIACGERATHDSGRWKPGMPCPRFTNREAAGGGGLFDPANQEDDNVVHYRFEVHSGWLAECLTEYARRSLVGVNAVVRAAEVTESLLMMNLDYHRESRQVVSVQNLEIASNAAVPTGLVDGGDGGLLQAFVQQLGIVIQRNFAWFTEFLRRQCLSFGKFPTTNGQTTNQHDVRFRSTPGASLDVREYGDIHYLGLSRTLNVSWSLYIKSMRDFFVQRRPDLQAWFHWTKAEDFKYLDVPDVRIDIVFGQNQDGRIVRCGFNRLEGGEERHRRAIYMAMKNRLEPLMIKHLGLFGLFLEQLRRTYRRETESGPRPFYNDRDYDLEELFCFRANMTAGPDGGEIQSRLKIPLGIFIHCLKTWAGLQNPRINVDDVPRLYEGTDAVHFSCQIGIAAKAGRITRLYSFHTSSDQGEMRDRDVDHKWLTDFFKRIEHLGAPCLDWIFQHLRDLIPHDGKPPLHISESDEDDVESHSAEKT